MDPSNRHANDSHHELLHENEHGHEHGHDHEHDREHDEHRHGHWILTGAFFMGLVFLATCLVIHAVNTVSTDVEGTLTSVNANNQN